MIEEAGRVVAVEAGAVWVETLRRSGCGRCDEPGGCGNGGGAGALAQRARERIGRVRALSGLPLQVGDEVVVGIPEGTLVSGTLLVYLLPVLLMVLGAAGGAALFPGDVGAVAGLLAGLVLAFVLIRRLSRQAARDPAGQPVVIRQRVAGEAAGCERGA